MSFYLISSVLLEYISKMINGIQRWTKGLYSYRKICDDCFKEKQFITKYIRFLFHCRVCLSVMSSSHTSEEGENLLEYDSKKKVWSLISFMFSDYVMFLFRIERCYSKIFQLFGLVTATSFDFLRWNFDQYVCCINK